MSTENLQPGTSRQTGKRLLAIWFVGALTLSGLAACSSASTGIAPSATSTSNQSEGQVEAEVTESTEAVVDREPTRVATSFAESITSEEVLEWVNAATGQMLNPPTDFMGLVWPIGRELMMSLTRKSLMVIPFWNTPMFSPKLSLTRWLTTLETGRQDFKVAIQRKPGVLTKGQRELSAG